jgi:hypothetical protein
MNSCCMIFEFSFCGKLREGVTPRAAACIMFFNYSPPNQTFGMGVSDRLSITMPL